MHRLLSLGFHQWLLASKEQKSAEVGSQVAVNRTGQLAALKQEIRKGQVSLGLLDGRLDCLVVSVHLSSLCSFLLLMTRQGTPVPDLCGRSAQTPPRVTV